MARGRLVADGPPDGVTAIAKGRGAVSFEANGTEVELLQRLPAVEAVELGRGRVTLRTEDPERTVRALLEATPHVDGLEVSTPRLEDAFLALTREKGPR